MHPAIIIGIVRSLIVDVAMGPIPRSTERISSSCQEIITVLSVSCNFIAKCETKPFRHYCYCYIHYIGLYMYTVIKKTTFVKVMNECIVAQFFRLTVYIVLMLIFVLYPLMYMYVHYMYCTGST